MKIGNCGRGGQVEPEGLKRGGSGAVTSTEFKDLLDQEVAGAQLHASCAPLQIETAGVGAVSFSPTLNSYSIGEVGASAEVPEVEHLEHVMDGVSTRLESGWASLAEVEGVIKSLQAEAEKLTALTAGISSEHPLAQLGQDLSVLSYVESIKWQRGDFV
jgi:hypothetical protein